jgi:integrase/recombinase XerD
MTLKDQFLRTISKNKNTSYMIKKALKDAESDIRKPVEDFDSNDVLTHIEKLQERKCIESTINLQKSKLKQFFRYCYDETDDIKYQKLIKTLKAKQIKGESVKPYDILTPEEVKRLINVASTERDKCLIAVLFESGMRIGELDALMNSMIQMEEQRQEVTFNIPNVEGCKTGERTIMCLEIYGYVRDWLKCNTSEFFMPISKNAMRVRLKSIFERAGITKPANPHNFRHSAITHAVNIGMQQNVICMRYWGVPNSAMLAVYIHLNEQMTSQGYRNAMGMGDNGIKIINPLAVRCVECGKLIETGNLCKQCEQLAYLKKQVIYLSKFINDNSEELIENAKIRVDSQ